MEIEQQRLRDLYNSIKRAQVLTRDVMRDEGLYTAEEILEKWRFYGDVLDDLNLADRLDDGWGGDF